MKNRTNVFLLAALLFVNGVFADGPKPATQPAARPKPQFQYSSGDIRISIPTADEPKVARFGADSIRAAAKYLDEGALCWTREKSCIACHTPGAYMVDRPLLTQQLGKPNEEVHASFVERGVKKLPETRQSDGITYYGSNEREVWRTAGLVQWDKYVSGKLSEQTDQALRNMLRMQASHGGYYMPGEVEIPYVTTDFEVTLHAARAIVDAPGWLAELKDADLLARIEKLKAFLRDSKPRNDYERALRIELAALMPELVDKKELQADVDMLWSKQKPDGGWSTRNMSDNHNWRTPMSERSLKVIESLPDKDNPGSDAYMTSLAIVLLRESGVPASDKRIQSGVAWLKGEQRVSGRWWMHSLYRGNYHFSTYIATSKAMQALAMCGEIPTLVAMKP